MGIGLEAEQETGLRAREEGRTLSTLLWKDGPPEFVGRSWKSPQGLRQD